jgi:regulator of protease activity HflC (stomatin/prohibitin superfamily)
VFDVRRRQAVVAGVLHTRLQLALRQAVAERDLDAALAERGELGTMIGDLVRRDAEAFGVMLHSVSVRDFMVGANLRTAFADVVAARQQGLAALERARGESAAVRNLANTAQLMEKHPGIMQLRLLQAVESGSGNRIVIALDPERGRALPPTSRPRRTSSLASGPCRQGAEIHPPSPSAAPRLART